MKRMGMLGAWIVVLLAGSPAVAAAGLPLADPVLSGPPVKITGDFTYTNDFITVYYTQPAVALVDMHGFITRDLSWEIPVASQVLGFLDLDTAKKTGSYVIDLPARPEATLSDVDPNYRPDVGVEVFAASYWPNLTGGPYSEGNDPSFGWPNYLASVRTDSENKDEVLGGKLVVWAPDANQRFPFGFGLDGLLFTSDDPMRAVPAGWSVIDLDQYPFTIDTQAAPSLTLYEPAESGIKDYSKLDWTAAWQALFASVSTNWAFNDIPAKHVDWQALYKLTHPRVVAAQQKDDAAAFDAALRDFILAIPDGHSGIFGELEDKNFETLASSGYGFSLVPLDDGRFGVIFVTPGSPAAKAGLKVGAIVTRFNGLPIAQAVARVQPDLTTSTAEDRTYQQSRYLLRAPVGTVASVTFTNRGARAKTARIRAIAERDSFRRTSRFYDAPIPTYPVEFNYLDSGAGYIRINSNYDDLALIVRQFEYALQQFEFSEITTIVIDMRYNSGGANLGLAGFLHDKPIALGQLEYYSDKTHAFEPEGPPEQVRPNQPQYEFARIAVLVSPACASACELEAYGFARVPNAIVVGMYSSAGIEAEVSRGQYILPEGITIQIPTGRFTNPDGSLFLEGVGVVPDVNVPVTIANLLSTYDVVLAAAERALAAGD